MADKIQYLKRGDTLFPNDTQAQVTARVGNSTWEGRERTFKNEDSANPGSFRDGSEVICRLVRNRSGIALKGKRPVVYVPGSRTELDGYASVASESVAGIMDEFLPSAGLRDDDWGWITVKGQTLYTSQETSNGENSWAIDDFLVASAHGTTSGSTGGHLKNFTLDGKTVSDTALLNKVGRAMVANTSSDTATDRLIDVDVWR